QEHLVAALRLVASGAGPQRHDRAVARTGSADRVEETPKPQLGDLVTELLHRAQFGIVAGGACREPRPFPRLFAGGARGRSHLRVLATASRRASLKVPSSS